PHGSDDRASRGASPWRGAWGTVPGRRGEHAVVPGRASAGSAAESGGTDSGPSAGPSPDSGHGPPLCRLPALPPSHHFGGPSAGRGPAAPGDRAGLAALGRAWHLLARLGAGRPGTGGGRPRAVAAGHGRRLGDRADVDTAAASGSARRGGGTRWSGRRGV